MANHERGAYTPQTDAPLAFDARRPGGGRRGFPTTLVISVVILVGLASAIFAFYRSGVRSADQAPVPVGSPVGEIKSAAAPPSSQAAASSLGLEVYKAEGGSATPAAPPAFAPPPEQPQARPVPAPVAAQPIPATPVAAPPPAAAQPAQVAASGATSKPAPIVVAAAPVKPVPAAPAPPAKAASAKAAKPDAIGDLLTKPSAAPAGAVPTGTLVQFGAFSSAALAGTGWNELASAYPSDMAGKGKLVQSVDHNGKTLFRGSVSGFKTHADAVAFCMKLQGAGKACLVK